MKEVRRITNREMEILAGYMDDEIREEVHFRFAPCTNEEFLAQVIIRDGIAKETITDVLNGDFEGFVYTYIIVGVIKNCMHSNNVINYTRIKYPDRVLCTEDSDIGNEYREYLNQFCGCLEVLGKEFPEMHVLSDLKEYFPEIGFHLESDYVFYTWNNITL